MATQFSSRLGPVLTEWAHSELQKFYAPGGGAEAFKIFLDTTCIEPLDWYSGWDAVPSYWRGVNDLDREWWPLKYGAQGFLPRMIERSPFYTSDWRRANASVVVLFVLHLSGALALTQQRCLVRLKKRSAAWRRDGGSRHFFVLPNDRGPCCLNGVYKDVEFMRHHVIGNGELAVAEAPSGRLLQHNPKVGARERPPQLPCFENHKDISIPTPNLHWPRKPHAKALPEVRHQQRRRHKRPYLLFHAGWNKFSWCRKKLVWLFADDTSSLVRAQLNQSDYVQGMSHSRFCPICGGYAPFTPRLNEALQAECVPIIVQQHWLLPFAELLNYSTFTVSVTLQQLPQLKEIALMADYTRLLSGVRHARRAFEYHLSGYTGRDMLPLLVYAMHNRLEHSTIPQPMASSASTSSDRSAPSWTRVEPLWNSVSDSESYTTRWAVPDGVNGSQRTFERAVLWQSVGNQIQNLSHNKPRGDAMFRVIDTSTRSSTVWHCRTAPLNFDARQCVCAKARNQGTG